MCANVRTQTQLILPERLRQQEARQKNVARIFQPQILNVIFNSSKMHLLKLIILVFIFSSCRKDRTITCVKPDGTKSATTQKDVTKKEVNREVRDLNESGVYGNCRAH